MYKIDFQNITINKNSSKELFKIIGRSIIKRKDKTIKENETTIKGEYCPKNKFGQSWAYTKETSKEEEED